MTADSAQGAHRYISTACMHGLCDGRCRRSCKYCNASCEHDCHPQQPGGDLPPPWTDQARDIAQQLLTAAGGVSGLRRAGLGELADKITSDLDLFWLRGEVQPPGRWRPAGADAAGDSTNPPEGGS